jgi:16S rRNA (cytosine967-C5)-methyltransferase
MTPSARLQAAMDILEGLGATDQPADRFMREWFRARRFAGSGDRREIGELVYRILRQRFSLSWRMGPLQAEMVSPRALVIAALLAEGRDPAPLFTGGYGPAPLTQAEREAIAAPRAEPPLYVRGEFPTFLEHELTRRFGTRLLEEMAAFNARAPVDLRVNTLKASREEVLAALRGDGFECEAIGLHAIRCPPNTASLNKHALFEAGAFEVQDLAAQIAVERAGAKPGMRVLDLAAGAGGKALALAAAMANKGAITACDIRPAALAELEKRAARAGAAIICTQIIPDDAAPEKLASPLEGPFDLVFLDAPCTGSGTWRRQPELKSRLTPARLAALVNIQDRLLNQAASHARQHLVYATCSILPSENEDRVMNFLAKNPAFRRREADFQASPATTGSDGFYAAFLTRN